MTSYILRRAGWVCVVLLGVSVVAFLIMQLTPGDPAAIMLGPEATPELLAAVRRDLGLDRPIHVQYALFLSRAIRGDFGRSIRSRQPVLSEIAVALPATVELATVALLIAVLVGVSSGIASAVWQRSPLDSVVRVLALLGVGMPTFWLGLMLIVAFALYLRILPAAGRFPPNLSLPIVTHFYLIDSLLAHDLAKHVIAWRHLVLPAITLASAPVATLSRMTRSSMLDVLNQDYLRTARAKGLRESVVVLRHGLRPSLNTVVTVFGLQMGAMLGGSALTETIFAWPGMGRLIVTGIHARDYPLIQGCILVTATIFCVINFLVDVAYGVVDPRIRLEAKRS